MKHLDRRKFLRQSLGGLAATAAAPLLQPQFILAEENNGSNTATGPIKYLVFVNLIGGFDPLFLFPPHHPAYYNALIDNGLRSSLLVDRDQVLALDSIFGLHPLWGSFFQEEYNAGRMALIQNIGTESYIGGSHAFAEAVMSFGKTNFSAGIDKGWFAKVLDLFGPPAYAFNAGDRSNDFRTTSDDRRPIVAKHDEGLVLNRDATGSEADTVLMRDTLQRLFNARRGSSDLEDKVIKALERKEPVSELFSLISNVSIIGSYPSNDFGRALKSVARTIIHFKNQPSRRLFYTTLRGFDTHANQLNNYTNSHWGKINTMLAPSFKALIEDLIAAGVYNETLIVGFTEFGRNLKENGGGGTDHGWGNTHFAFGGALNGGRIIGDPFPVSHLSGNFRLPVYIPFQNLFAQAIQATGIDADQVFHPGTYTHIDLNLV